MKKNKVSERMYQYKFTDEDMEAVSYCLNNDIHISPHPLKDPNMFKINIVIRGKSNISPQEFNVDEVIPKQYEYYRYYYNLNKQT